MRVGNIPATFGADMEVPARAWVEHVTEGWAPGESKCVLSGTPNALFIMDPGAITSGFSRPSCVGPWELNQATVMSSRNRSVSGDLSSLAPTQTPFLASAGVITVRSPLAP